MVVPGPSAPVAAVDEELQRLTVSLRATARRGRRFSWFSWGYLFAVYVGQTLSGILILLLFLSGPVNGAAISDGVLVGLAFTPAIALLALAVREVFVGRRETYGSWERLRVTRPATGFPEEVGWVANVQEAQRMISQTKNDLDWSFLPLALGTIGFGLIGFNELLVGSLSSLTTAYPWLILLPEALAFATTLLLVPFYYAVRDWVVSYQELLDREVRELTRLESEFLWRFTGAPV